MRQESVDIAAERCKLNQELRAELGLTAEDASGKVAEIYRRHLPGKVHQHEAAHLYPCNCHQHRDDLHDPGWEQRQEKPRTVASHYQQVWMQLQDGMMGLIDTATGEIASRIDPPDIPFMERNTLPVPF